MFVVLDSIWEDLSCKSNNVVVFPFSFHTAVHQPFKPYCVCVCVCVVYVTSYPVIVAQGGWSASSVALRCEECESRHNSPVSVRTVKSWRICSEFDWS